MLRIVLVRALGGLRVELERWMIQFLEADLAGVITHHGKSAHQTEKVPPLFFARPLLGFIRQWLEQRGLKLWRQRQEIFAVLALRAGIQPAKSRTEGVLHRGVVSYEEVDKLRGAGFQRPGRGVAGNDDIGEPLDDRIFRRGEEDRCIDGCSNRLYTADVAA